MMKKNLNEGVILAEQMFGYNQSTYKGVLRTESTVAVWYFYNVRTGKPVTEDKLYEELIDRVSNLLGEQSMTPIVLEDEDPTEEFKAFMRHTS